MFDEAKEVRTTSAIVVHKASFLSRLCCASSLFPMPRVSLTRLSTHADHSIDFFETQSQAEDGPAQSCRCRREKEVGRCCKKCPSRENQCDPDRNEVAALRCEWMTETCGNMRHLCLAMRLHAYATHRSTNKWTEETQMQLANLVRSKQFDFEAVAKSLASEVGAMAR